MGVPPITDEQAKAAADAYRSHGFNKSEAARSIDLPRQTFNNRLNRAAERGMLLDAPAAMPGFRISRVADGPGGQSVEQKPERGELFKTPTGHRIKGVSTLLDADGRKIVEWIKTREDDLDPAVLVEWIKAAFADYNTRTTPAPAPVTFASDILTLVPLADWHIGMYGWHREVGENWDLEIAETAIGNAVEDMIGRSPSSAECVVLGGGDLIHSDNNDNKTARSGNVLQVDGRYDKVIGVASRLVARTIDAALRRHDHVTVRILKGNHDKHASVAVAYHLLGWYRTEPRVTVDVDPSLFWWHRFGSVMLGATHGDEVKIIKMPEIMAHRRAPDWGLTKFRFVHGFHMHHSAKYATEGGGVISEVHQAPIPQDAWHYGAGYLSGRSVQAITYHKDFGEVGRVRVAMLDGAGTK